MSRCRRRQPRFGGHEDALHAGCGREDLERAHHIESGEPGVKQIRDLHLFSVWPRRDGHKDTLLTMSATPLRRTVRAWRADDRRDRAPVERVDARSSSQP
jgi:hypothetical protein